MVRIYNLEIKKWKDFKAGKESLLAEDAGWMKRKARIKKKVALESEV